MRVNWGIGTDRADSVICGQFRNMEGSRAWLERNRRLILFARTCCDDLIPLAGLFMVEPFKNTLSTWTVSFWSYHMGALDSDSKVAGIHPDRAKMWWSPGTVTVRSLTHTLAELWCGGAIGTYFQIGKWKQELEKHLLQVMELWIQRPKMCGIGPRQVVSLHCPLWGLITPFPEKKWASHIQPMKLGGVEVSICFELLHYRTGIGLKERN